jgi:hypothetical protein
MAASEWGVVDAVGELGRQVRHGTLQLLHVPDPAWLTWSPPGTANHILWHAGHALWLQDALTVRPLTGHCELPRGWSSVFGQNSRPATTADWPSVSEVRTLLEAQLRRVLELLAHHAESIAANREKVFPAGGWPLLPGMIHGWHDEARHQGEMYLLHKLSRRRLR